MDVPALNQFAFESAVQGNVENIEAGVQVRFIRALRTRLGYQYMGTPIHTLDELFDIQPLFFSGGLIKTSTFCEGWSTAI
ncbi:hypothetical protein J6590_087193 [Homalodisca vitripennis]|nr:hypothetical protein J6590_087193 [Homalodisca vitripennis]